MRSFAVRILFLALVVLVAVLWPRPVREPVDGDPVGTQLYAFLRAVADLDHRTDGAFSSTLRRVLADPAVSVEVGVLRLPAREGIDAVLATFPKRPVGAEGVHDQMLVVFVAAALQDCKTDAARRQNFLALAEKYRLLASSRR